MKVVILSVLLCLMVAIESTVIKYVQSRQEEDIYSEQLVFLVEVFKFIVSFVFYIFYEPKKLDNRTVVENYGSMQSNLNNENDENENDQVLHNDVDPLETMGNSSVIWFILPACLYAVSNNVTFAALMLMSPALFNLLMNLKIPLTGLMACALLHYRLTRNLAVSFLFLFVGSIFATLKWGKDGKITIEGSMYGLILMFVYATCSAGGAVYTEYVTKIRYGNESINLQNIKFCLCSIVANVVLMAIRGITPFTTLHPLHLASVAALAMNGLVTSVVLKYAGSIVKTYAVSAAAFLSAIFTWCIFHQKLQWNFYVGGIVCFLSVMLYIQEKKRCT